MRRLVGAALAALIGTCACVSARADTFIVNVGGTGAAFNPQTLSIRPGDTVTFVNKGGYHNVVADDGSFRCAHGCDGQPGGYGSASSSNWVASVTFPAAGVVGYFCEIHGAPGEGMFGTINVIAPPPPTVAGIPLGGWLFGALLAGALALAAAAVSRRRQRVA